MTKEELENYVMTDEQRRLVMMDFGSFKDLHKYVRGVICKTLNDHLNEGHRVKVDVDEFVAAAFLAICHAAGDYDPERTDEEGKKATFRTYATSVIETSFYNTIKEHHIVQVSKRDREKYRILSYDDMMRNDGLLFNKFLNYGKYGTFDTELDKKTGEVIYSKEKPRTKAQTHALYTRRAYYSEDYGNCHDINYFFSFLSAFEQKVVSLRFGICKNRPWTIEEIAECLDTKPEEVKAAYEDAKKTILCVLYKFEHQSVTANMFQPTYMEW